MTSIARRVGAVLLTVLANMTATNVGHRALV